MEYLIFVVALGLYLVVMFIKGLWDKHRRGQWLRKRLRESFGKEAAENDHAERRDAVKGYLGRHNEGFVIDDITWNDLEMDRIFGKMDTTLSSAGQEYLYYLLRTPVFCVEELAKREQMICFFTEEELERVSLQMLFGQLGKTGKYSIYDYIGFLGNLGQRKNLPHILGDLLLLPAIGLLVINGPMGMLTLLLVIGFNIAAYLKDKRQIEPYLISFKYVFRALDAAQKLAEMPQEKIQHHLAEEIRQIKALLKCFSGLKRSGHFGMRAMGGDGGNPMEILIDYVNMIFHVDLIAFNLMKKQLEQHEEDIDRLLGILGKIEALIAAASYRASLEQHCVPVLGEECISGKNSNVNADGTQNTALYVNAEQIYHPLLKDPVKNDISVRRGVLLTGSNASGKSTFLKAIAINGIFAQTIHTCAAASYHSSFFRVMSSMALRDDLSQSESYYIVEIRSLKRILDSIKQSGAPVLCFVDEVLRGTNTVERIAASTQILKSLCAGNVLCFAATHDIELTELLETYYENYHFREQIIEGDIIFSYKLYNGRAQTRNAIRLLEIMGYEEQIIKEADWLAAYFLENGSWQAN